MDTNKELVVVQVRAREDQTRRGRYIAGCDPVTGNPYVLTAEPQELTVPAEVVTRWESDRWVEVKRFDARLSATKKMNDALAAEKDAEAAEASAATLRAKATALRSDAEAAVLAAKDLPAPVVAPQATPFQDQLRAALPDDVRDQVDAQKLGMSVVREQIMSSSVQRATSPVSAKAGGTIDNAVSQAIGKPAAPPQQPQGKPQKK